MKGGGFVASISMTGRLNETKMTNDTHRVIDGETMKVIEMFHENQTEQMIEKYKSIGKWEDVKVDRDGDLILWENE